ncbi:MAG: 2-oxoglutarate dehydrogenase E1 component, partial [Gammaproteobacteria bacterium]|nr:2-oxoglutarate dehydrogenase E1 component [Gammaproteobacteria bacterium]
MTGDKYQSLIQSSAIQGGNGAYVEALYESYLDAPDSVDGTWQAFFRGLRVGAGAIEQPQGPVRSRFEALARQRRMPAAAPTTADAVAFEKQSGVLRLINYHRVRGHQAAKLDPLGLAPIAEVPDLDPGFHGLRPEDMDCEFQCGTLATAERLTLREIIGVLKHVYTGSIGAQYMYINETAQKRWIQQRLERDPFKPRFSAERKKAILTQLVAAEGIERYLHNKYVGQKRF